MAKIREYRKEKLIKEHSDGNKIDYDKKLRLHRIRVKGFLTILIAIAVITIIVTAIINSTRTYSDYVIEKTERRTDSGYATYFNDSDGYVKCSRDGVSAYGFNNELRWNKTYDISRIAVDRCGSYFAVADIGSNYVYVFDNNGYISTINTVLSIVKIGVSSKGHVALILEDKDAVYIDMYDKDGNRIYTIKTTAASDGIPTDIGVSMDGRKLAVAFTAIKGVDIKTSVVFYNFGEVGQNENERIVGGFDFYDNQLIGEVEFLNENTVVAVSENIISFYTIKEYPKLIKNIEIEHKIEQIFYSDEKFAYLYTDDNHKRQLCVYNIEGEKAFDTEIDDVYTSFEFVKKGIIMYGKDEFRLLSEKGKDKYKDHFETEISQVIPLKKNDEYLFITIEKLHKVKLK